MLVDTLTMEVTNVMGLTVGERDAPASAVIGARVRALRKEQGLSRRAVTRATGFTALELALVERGTKRLTVDDCRSLAGSLGVRLSELAPGDTDFAAASEGSHEARIDALLDQSEPRSPFWLTIKDFAAAPPIELSDRERRRDRRTRGRVEQIWNVVVRDMNDALEACRRLTAANSNDDADQLVRDAACALDRLRNDSGFRRHAARHRRLLRRVRRRTQDTVRAPEDGVASSVDAIVDSNRPRPEAARSA